MSGHSHAKTVLRRKTAEDQKRGKIFSKIGRMISVAAKEGDDPNMNAKLKQALDEAKSANMPKENITRAIRKGTGAEAGEKLEEVIYEALLPGGVQIILEGITDNKNRTLSEIRQILQKHGGKLANEGSVKWAFEQRGIIVINVEDQETVKSREDLEMAAIDAGAEDVRCYQETGGGLIEAITSIEGLERTKQALEKQSVKIDSATLGWVAKEEIEVSAGDKEKCEKLFGDLDDNEAIQEIYSNLKV